MTDDLHAMQGIEALCGLADLISSIDDRVLHPLASTAHKLNNEVKRGG